MLEGPLEPGDDCDPETCRRKGSTAWLRVRAYKYPLPPNLCWVDACNAPIENEFVTLKPHDTYDTFEQDAMDKYDEYEERKVTGYNTRLAVHFARARLDLAMKRLQYTDACVVPSTPPVDEELSLLREVITCHRYRMDGFWGKIKECEESLGSF